MKPTYFILFLVMFGLGVAGYIFVRGEHFPALIVNGATIPMREFNEHRAALTRYYEVLIERGELADASVTSVDQITDQLRRATIDQLVEDTLIARALERELDEARRATLIAQKLSNVEGRTDTDDFGAAVGNLYGLSVDRFRELALVPQARRELLTDALRDRKEEMAAWLASARTEASVRILIPGFHWEDGVVAIAEE